MNVSQLSTFLPEIFVKRLEALGIKELNPPQKLAIEAGLLEGKNLVIASPTASGKTLIALLAIAKRLSSRRGKAIYLVPLRALANEKFHEFSEFFEGIYRIAISTGDFDSSDPWLEDYDIIILTVEKADSLLRHRARWMEDVRIVVADEIHLLNDVDRGPTLEMVLTKLRRYKPQILALSATIKNVDEIASWLDANAVKTNYRPIKLREGVLNSREIRFIGEIERLDTNYEKELAVVEDTLKKGKQILIFVSTRKNAETLSERICNLVERFLSESEKKELVDLSSHIENALETPTAQCRKLAEVCKCGVAFHHAGLVSKQRKLIEENFRRNLIKAIVATPTLAAGVNLPAFRCLIRDVKRYYPGYGSVYIPVLEYQQMAGRAGRPKYDKEGEAIILARSEREVDELFDRYILGEPEEIYSKLAVEPILRMHVLALIATDITKENDLYEFLSKTFYAHQFGNISRIAEIVRKILDDLIDWRFVVQINEKLIATRLGKRVSELYIDPESAWRFISAIEKYRCSEFGLLHLVCSVREMFPLLRVKNNEYSDIQFLLVKRENQLMCEVEDYFYVDEFLDSFKTALLFDYWINEASEDYLYNKFGVTPGELFTRIEIADWLLYAIEELSVLLGKKDVKQVARKLRLRIKHGVKEELINLVSIKGIGRKRARKLWESGVRNASDLKKIPLERLKALIGEKTAEKIKEAVS
jgi:helicase